MAVKNLNRRGKIANRIAKFFLVLLFIYLIFLIYNNLDLGAKRQYVYYDNLSFLNNTFIYNSQIISGTEPIFISRGNSAVLLLHGMGGTPIELSELAYFLADNNISVFVPLLPSQGRSYEEIKSMDAEEVYSYSLNSLNFLKENYDYVFVGGLSTGGSLSLKLAEKESVSGIISLATPIIYGFDFLGDSTLPLFKALSKITPSLRRVEWGLANNVSISEVLPSFDRLPVSVLIQGELLKKETKDNLNNINEPILILQSKKDNRAAPSSAKYIFDHVNSSEKKLIYLNSSGHVITMDYDKTQVFNEIYNFIITNSK